MEFVPVNKPSLNGNELKYLAECIESGWISSEGPFVEEFEKKFAERIGRKAGIAVSNGSAALELAVAALGIGPGDEVILPTFTIISCALAITRAGAIPVLVDCDPNTWNMSVDEIEGKITDKTKAVMAVHIFGLPVDLDPLLALCNKHGIMLIEDSAESIGLNYRNNPCGSFGEISAFSFYANKHVTMGEGGLVAVNNEHLEARCRSFRNLCFKEPRFVHEHLGWNMRLTNLQAAVGLAQLERLDWSISKKRYMGELYNRHLADVPGLQLPIQKTEYAENCYWVYGIVLGDLVELDAQEMMQTLREKKIDSRPFFWPLHQQPVFNREGKFLDEHHPVSENIARRGLYLPSGTTITDDQIEYVAETVKSILKRKTG